MRRRIRDLKDDRRVTDRCGPTNKARYRSEGAALAALDRIQEQAMVSGDTRRQERRAYRCPLCNGYHLTKQVAA